MRNLGMKRIVVFVIGVILFSACHNYKKDAQRLSIVQDSIMKEAALKDSSIVDLLGDFNEIQNNLDSIKELEKMVTVQSKTQGELTSTQKQRIIEDIMLINELMQKNKELISSLQKKLRNSNYKIGELEGTLNQLQLMVNNLETEMQGKNEVIMTLAAEVEKLNVDISSLQEKIAEVENESQQKSDTIYAQTERLNKAYYVLGSLKELKDNEIIEKSGGVLGIGKTPVIKKDFNRSYFTEIDIRNLDYIPLMVKKAKLVSVHPADSYHISGAKGADTLFIEDSAEFWKASKYLVIILN